MNCLALVGSVTDAMQLEESLRRKNIRSQVVSTPCTLSKSGCGYSVRFSDDEIEQIKRIVAEKRIEIKDYYLIERKGRRIFYKLV